jgi:hypothetical protein
MDRIETFEDLLALAPGTAVYQISSGHVLKKTFLGKYDKEHNWWVAVLVPLEDYDRMDWSEFQSSDLYTSITQEGAREVAIEQIEHIKAACVARWDREIERAKALDLGINISFGN